jgi:hypothetical protein
MRTISFEESALEYAVTDRHRIDIKCTRRSLPAKDTTPAAIGWQCRQVLLVDRATRAQDVAIIQDRLDSHRLSPGNSF